MRVEKLSYYGDHHTRQVDYTKIYAGPATLDEIGWVLPRSKFKSSNHDEQH
jgi:hypothetical protein